MSTAAGTAHASGIERVATAFASARANGRRAALMPYLMAGYPDLDTSRRIVRAYVDGGADLIELGIPFSDPLADGPVIHSAAVAALRGGVRIDDAIAVAQEVSARVPVIAMCYVNPILVLGVDRFVDRLARFGVAGVIVPDAPLEESEAILAACDAAGLAFVPLLAPTTPEDRLARIGRRARGFLYTVSVAGTTGEREDIAARLPAVVARARSATDVPVAVGFGITTPADAAAAADAGADGVIVGTRLVRAAGEDPDGIAELVGAFSTALRDRPVG